MLNPTAPREATAPTVVFLGPTCPSAVAATIIDADFQPPAKKGDFYRLLQTDVAVIVLIDGVFHGEPSVWHDEILAAVDEGIRVIGASSMGALRAAELHDLGVEGHGTVFEWYRDGEIDGDDEVALHHGWSDESYIAISEPLVNIRATLQAAVAAGQITADRASELIEEVRATHYPERSYRRMMAGRAVQGWSSQERASLAAFLERGRVNIKERDALGALVLARGIADALPSSSRLPFRRAPRVSLLPNQRIARRIFRAADGRELRFDGVLERAKKRGDFARLIALVTCRWCALRVAEMNHLGFPPDELARIARRRTADLDGIGRAELLRRNSLTASEYATWVENEARFEWLLTSLPSREIGPDARAAASAAFADGDPRIAAGWGFVAEWATSEGLRCPEPAASTELDDLALARWVMTAGPEAFGFSSGGTAALVLELQAADRISDLLEP